MKGEPFTAGYGDFVRAYLRYEHSAAPKVFERLRARLNMLQFLEAGFRELGREADITLLTPDVLNKAVEVAGRGAAVSKYQRASSLQKFLRFCSDHHLLAAPFTWRHGVRKPKEIGDRLGEEFAKRRAARLPGPQALDALARVFREPTCFRDEVFGAVAALCLCVPIRIHEVLQLRTDCLCEELRTDTEQGKVNALGIRVWPGKGNPPAVKWIPDLMAGLAREAVARLLSVCGDARTIAAAYEEAPATLYWPPALAGSRRADWLRGEDLESLTGVNKVNAWASSNGVRRRGGTFPYSAPDVERVILCQIPKDFPLHNGHPGHPYSRALILVRKGSLRADALRGGSNTMFEPASIDAFNAWLGGAADGRLSVFERYGASNEDGSPIRLTSHGFRHWLNDIAHRRGIPALSIAEWSGRDPSQNKFYDHQTPQQFRDQLLDLSIRAGGIGPVFDASDAAPEPRLITRGEFLSAQIGSAHQTDLGVCIHDYSLLPCQKFGDCIGCEENLFVKGDREHRASVSAVRERTAAQLEAARLALEDGDFGADLWARDHVKKLRRLDEVIGIHDDGAIPDGRLVSMPGTGSDTEVSMALRSGAATAPLREGYDRGG